MDMRTDSWIIVAALLSIAGCHQGPMQPDHGYPANWPALTALSQGYPELDGTYANQGLAFSEEGGTMPITLASLIPQPTPFGEPKKTVPSLDCGDCVSLRLLPSTSQWHPYPTLRATLPGSEGARVFDVETYRDVDALLYLLELSGDDFVIGLGHEQTRVFLTVAKDRSLIAKIYTESGGLVLIVPYHFADYTWARFERIGD